MSAAAYYINQYPLQEVPVDTQHAAEYAKRSWKD